MAERRCELAVVGGGPAGVATALAAAGAGLSVTLFEASGYDRARPGETLSAAARPVLDRLALTAAADATSLPVYGFESAWGGEELASRPTLLGPYGPGWHLDRPRFDAALADAAAAAGVTVLRGQPVAGCVGEPGGGWRLAPAGRLAQVVVDATGRGARLARRLGARRRVRDHLVGVARVYRGAPPAGSTLVEAAPDGWWYAAPLPRDRAVAVLMTDADLCRAGRRSDDDGWSAALARTRHVAARVGDGEPEGRPRVVAAVSHRLDRGAGGGPWLATGDAALAVDPLSGSGLLRALLAGEAAGLAAAAWVFGHPEPARDYERWLDERFAAYWRERELFYALEDRWPGAPFWRRRRVSRPGPIGLVDPVNSPVGAILNTS